MNKCAHRYVHAVWNHYLWGITYMCNTYTNNRQIQLFNNVCVINVKRAAPHGGIFHASGGLVNPLTYGAYCEKIVVAFGRRVLCHGRLWLSDYFNCDIPPCSRQCAQINRIYTCRTIRSTYNQCCTYLHAYTYILPFISTGTLTRVPLNLKND